MSVFVHVRLLHMRVTGFIVAATATVAIAADSSTFLRAGPSGFKFAGVDGGKGWSTTSSGVLWGDTRKHGIDAFDAGLCGPEVPHKDVQESHEKPVVLQRIESQGMSVATKDGDINIVGVRKNNPINVCQPNQKENECWNTIFTNHFDDTLHLIWHCAGDLNVYRSYTTPMTTLPGWALQKRRITSVMKPGQYKNKYCMGSHGGTPALKCMGVDQWILEKKDGNSPKQNVYRLQGTSNSPIVSNSYALNFHSTILKGSRGYPYTPTDVNNWSEGCQVTPGKVYRDVVLPLIKMSLEDEALKTEHKGACKSSNRADCSKCITYTLLDSDASSASITAPAADKATAVEEAPGNSEDTDDTKNAIHEKKKPECELSPKKAISAVIRMLCTAEPKSCAAKKAAFVDLVYCLSSKVRGHVERANWKKDRGNYNVCKIEKDDDGYNFHEEVQHWKTVSADPEVKCVSENGYTPPELVDCSQHKTSEDCKRDASTTWCSWGEHHASSSSLLGAMTSMLGGKTGRCLCGNGMHCCTSAGRVNTCEKTE